MYKNAFEGNYHNTVSHSDKTFLYPSIIFHITLYWHILLPHHYLLNVFLYLLRSLLKFQFLELTQILWIYTHTQKKTRMSISISSYKLFLFTLIREYGYRKLRLSTSNDHEYKLKREGTKIWDALWHLNIVIWHDSFDFFLLHKIPISDRRCPPLKWERRSYRWRSSQKGRQLGRDLGKTRETFSELIRILL